MLHPAGTGINLLMLLLRHRYHAAGAIKYHKARAGRPLVDCANVARQKCGSPDWIRASFSWRMLYITSAWRGQRFHDGGQAVVKRLSTIARGARVVEQQ